MTAQSDDRLSKRYWMIKNIDWLLDEVVFHKENHEYYNNTKIPLWDLGAERGEATIDATTR